MPSSKHHHHNHHQKKKSGSSAAAPGMISHNASTEFKSVLRIRPLLKKEREDQIVLEPLSNGIQCAVLHPSAVLSPHSANNAVHSAQDIDYYFDRVVSSTASQDRFYMAVGQPIALATMESLKKKQQLDHHPTTKPPKKKTHVVLGMGLLNSGKTYTLAGNYHYLSKRRNNDSDGLVPRMLDSLYSQSKHNIATQHINNNNKKKLDFVVKVTILQVNQSKSNPADCQVYDLLQPLPKTTAGNLAVETIGHLATSLLSTVDRSISTSSSSTNGSNGKSNHYSQLSEPVKVQQDPVTSECFLANGTVKHCTDIEDARETVQKAMGRSRQLSSKKNQSHCFFQIQPVLVSSRSGRVVQEGETIAILDMASCDPASGRSKQRTSSRLRGDSLSNRDDAHTAVLHCLKAIRHNEKVMQRDGGDDSHNKESSSSIRKVPFLQHKVTMLLQPLFSTKYTEKTEVTLLVHATPSHRDYSEKKALLSELAHIYRPTATTINSATTGTERKTKSSKSSKKKDSSIIKKSNTSKKAKFRPDDRFIDNNETPLSEELVEPLERCHSMTYSDSTAEDNDGDAFLDDPMPPPVAPGYKGSPPDNEANSSSAPSAADFISPPPISTVDFPGAPIPLASTRSALTESSHPATTISCAAKSTTTHESSIGESVETEDVSSKESTSKQGFSYMKKINKVVQSSAKKGRKVMERMAVTTSSNGDGELHRRVSELEDRNSALANENERLKMELYSLKKKYGECDSISDEEGEESVTCNDLESMSTSVPSPVSSNGPQRQKSPKLDDDTTFSISSKTFNSTTSGDPENVAPGSFLYDNPLFAHMANNNSDEPNRQWCTTDKEASSSPTYSHQQDGGEASTPEMERPKAVFEEQLFQHMAMMNNMG